MKDRGRTQCGPLGDFFCSADALHPFHTWQRTITADGTMVCRWVMPYRTSAVVRLLNLGSQAVDVALQADTGRWDWDARSMHFHANWRPDDVVHGTPFQDWNYIDICGEGVFVGDSWTVLNIQGSWWGEDDEKIYVDGEAFPSHFGTGTEDYYGYAWCWPGLFTHAYQAQPRCDGPGTRPLPPAAVLRCASTSSPTRAKTWTPMHRSVSSGTSWRNA